MKDVLFGLEAGTLNTVYDKIINCTAIKQICNTKSISGQEFMLDKRPGLISQKSIVGQNFYDYIDIEGVRFFYGKDEITGRLKLFNDKYELISSHPFREGNPIRLTKGRGGGGQLILNATETTNNLTPQHAVKNPQAYNAEASYTQGDGVTSGGSVYMCIKNIKGVAPPNDTYWSQAISAVNTSILNPYYDGGLIKLNVPGHGWTETRSRYITITSGILKGITNKILYANGNDIYISGTNVYGSLPENNDKYFIFSDARDTIVLGTDDGVTIISLTDKKENFNFYYNLVITYGTYLNYLAISIDGNKILLDGNNDVDNKAILESKLGSGYIVEIKNGLLFLAKNNGNEITFNILNSVFKLNIHFLIKYYSDNYPYFVSPSLGLNFGATKFHLGSWESYNGDIFLQKIDGGYKGQSFYKNRFYMKILSSLPTGYSGVIKTNGPYVVNLGYNQSGRVFDEWILNDTLLLRKDDLTENSITKYNTYGTKISLYSDTNSSYNIVNIILSVDGINYTYSYNNVYIGSQILSAVLSLINTVPNIITTTVFEISSYNVFSIHGNDGRNLNVSISFTGNPLPPSNWINIDLEDYSTSFENALYGVDLMGAVPTECGYFNSPYSLLNVNNINAYTYNALTGSVIDGKQDLNVLDIVVFNGAVFVLTDNQIFFSRITFDDNTHFYSLDQFPYRGGKKLISFGQALIVIGEENKIITKTSITLFGTDGVTSYVMKDLEFNGTLFSKYSYKYTEGVLYFLQKDRRLMTIQIAENDATSYRVSSNEISKNYRYLFENVQGECFVEQEGKFLNFIFVNGGTSENVRFDLSMNDWIVNKYDKPIYRIGENILTGITNISETGHIAIEGGYTDFGNSYKQEINFSIGNLIKFTKVSILRTIFGLTKENRLDLTLTVEREEANGIMNTSTYHLNNYLFDVSLDTNPDGDELIGQEIQEKYNGNLAGIQIEIERAGRFTRFKYESENRFIMGSNYLLSSSSKPYINDILSSN